MARGRHVALVLGSGGARGYAHIGAIEELADRGFEIVTVAGSSMGALVGGLYAAGELEAFTEWAVGLSRRDVARLVDVSLTRAGLARAERVLSRIRGLVGDVRIEELPMPFTAVATDLDDHREVWFQRGPLDVAIRASIALPGIFTPVMLNGRLLADGGLVEPLPVAPTAAVPADLTVAVALGGQREAGGAAVAESADPGPLDEWVARFRLGASQVLGAGAHSDDAAPVEGDPEELPAGLRGLDVMSRALEVMQDVVSRYRLAGFPPDVLVTVPRDAAGTLDFHRAPEMIELGRSLCAEALDVYEAQSAAPGLPMK